jgi:molybdopterin molybdotransferase
VNQPIVPGGIGEELGLPSPEVAWRLVQARWSPAAPAVEEVALAAALGRITAAAIRAPLDLPPYDRAAMDGYAVAVADLTNAAANGLRLAGEVPMGAAAPALAGPGDAIWVATGSMIPAGADAVVQVEHTRLYCGRIFMESAVVRGAHIVPRGSDLIKGAEVLPRGRRLRPHDIAALAGLGLATIPVVRKPRVAVLISGDELCEPGTTLGPCQIYSCNGEALRAASSQLGAETMVWPLLPDHFDTIAEAVRDALARTDLVLLSGGSSVGRKDYTFRALEALPGARMLVHGVASKPAHPTIVAAIDNRLVIGIPGNPTAALIAFTHFAAPALEALLGVDPAANAAPPSGARIQARIAAPLQVRGDRQEHVFVTLQREPFGTWVATPLPHRTGQISTLARADGMIVVHSGEEAPCIDQTVEVHIF